MENNNMEKTLFNKFHQCTNLMFRYHHHSHQNIEDKWLHPGQNRLLSILSMCDGISQSELAKKLFIRPASLSELLTKLEQKGYVKREQDEKDKRVVNIFLTDEGKAFSENITENHGNWFGGLFVGLNEEEQNQLSKLLDKIIKSLQSELKESEGNIMHNRPCREDAVKLKEFRRNMMRGHGHHRGFSGFFGGMVNWDNDLQFHKDDEEIKTDITFDPEDNKDK